MQQWPAASHCGFRSPAQGAPCPTINAKSRYMNMHNQTYNQYNTKLLRQSCAQQMCDAPQENVELRIQPLCKMCCHPKELKCKKKQFAESNICSTTFFLHHNHNCQPSAQTCPSKDSCLCETSAGASPNLNSRLMVRSCVLRGSFAS